jgi:N-terminal 7TM region of histidine kinase
MATLPTWLVVGLIEFLKAAPLASATAWFVLAILQVYRDRWHTWTEAFFLFCCFFAGLYAIGDFLLFSYSTTTGAALLSSLVSLAGLTLAVNFFLLFTLVYVDRMRRSYGALMAVSVGMLLLVWGRGITTVRPLTFEGQTLYVAFFDPWVFGAYLVYIIAYAVVGIWNLYRLYKIVRESSKTLARRAAGLMVTFTLVLVLGLVTNGLIGITQLAIPPPLSTLLIFVAASAYYTLYPIGRERISEAIRMFQARRYSIKAVFLTFHDGTLIGAKTKPGETTIDQDLFGATLDVIQNFMRTSFPILRGKSLSSIVHGSYTLVIEKARLTYLTVVLEGEETDQLRRQMRDVLIAFEAQNRQVLQKWQGLPSEARGTEQLLTGFFVESPLV